MTSNNQVSPVIRISQGDRDASARATHLEAANGKFPLTTNERKQMSTKTNFKRIALVAVAALGLGVLSSVPSQAVMIGTLSVTTSDANATTSLADSTTAGSLTLRWLSGATADSVVVSTALNTQPTGGAPRLGGQTKGGAAGGFAAEPSASEKTFNETADARYKEFSKTIKPFVNKMIRQGTQISDPTTFLKDFTVHYSNELMKDIDTLVGGIASKAAQKRLEKIKMEIKQITKEMRDKLRNPLPQEALKQHPTKTFLTSIKPRVYLVVKLKITKDLKF
jgi:hypothetical protein